MVKSMMSRVVSSFMCGVFAVVTVTSDVMRCDSAFAAELSLPAPTQMITASKEFSYPVLKGLKIDPNNPLNLEFVIDTMGKDKVDEEEAQKLVNYFLTAVAVPQEDLWVNLSPYEKDRVVTDELGATVLGEQLLAQDYLLKQLSSSLTDPNTETGKAYWSSASQISNLKSENFKKIWIKPDVAQVYENDNQVFVTGATLDIESEDATNAVLLPAIKKEVNEGEHFASIRQAYYSIILGLWFKEKLRSSIFKDYIDAKNVNGIAASNPQSKEQIFNAYVESFKKGVYNQTAKTRENGKLVKKAYFSGGFTMQKGEAGSAIVEKVLTNINLSNLIGKAYLLPIVLTSCSVQEPNGDLTTTGKVLVGLGALWLLQKLFLPSVQKTAAHFELYRRYRHLIDYGGARDVNATHDLAMMALKNFTRHKRFTMLVLAGILRQDADHYSRDLGIGIVKYLNSTMSRAEWRELEMDYRSDVRAATSYVRSVADEVSSSSLTEIAPYVLGIGGLAVAGMTYVMMARKVKKIERGAVADREVADREIAQLKDQVVAKNGIITEQEKKLMEYDLLNKELPLSKIVKYATATKDSLSDAALMSALQAKNSHAYSGKLGKIILETRGMDERKAVLHLIYAVISYSPELLKKVEFLKSILQEKTSSTFDSNKTVGDSGHSTTVSNFTTTYVTFIPDDVDWDLYAAKIYFGAAAVEFYDGNFEVTSISERHSTEYYDNTMGGHIHDYAEKGTGMYTRTLKVDSGVTYDLLDTMVTNGAMKVLYNKSISSALTDSRRAFVASFDTVVTPGVDETIDGLIENFEQNAKTEGEMESVYRSLLNRIDEYAKDERNVGFDAKAALRAAEIYRGAVVASAASSITNGGVDLKKMTVESTGSSAIELNIKGIDLAMFKNGISFKIVSLKQVATETVLAGLR